MVQINKRELKDRTKEFRLLSNALRKRQASSGNNALDRQQQQKGSIIGHDKNVANRFDYLNNPNKKQEKEKEDVKYSEKTIFAKSAKMVAKEIQDTTLILEELAVLSKRRTMFEDYSTKINELTNNVKQRIALINNHIADLQKKVNSAKDNNTGIGANSGGTVGKQIAQHNSNVVVLLQSKLANTSNTFKGVLEIRRENLKESTARREKLYAGKQDSLDIGLQETPRYMSKRRQNRYNVDDNYSGKQKEQQQPQQDYVSFSLPDFEESRAQQSQQLILEQEHKTNENSYLSTRNDAIKTIESTISELGGIFQQLAHMVSEQSDVVQRIDAQIEDVEMNITGAHSELLSYYSNLSSNRWLMIKIFLILIVTVVGFVLFS